MKDASPAVGESIAVSVVICTRNRAALLPHCLRSLTTQSSPVPFEIVVVDNGSQDETAAVVREWALADSRICPVREPAPGLSIAKNVGIRRARGQLVIFTDDDVVLAEGWISAYLSFFAERPELVELAGGPVLPVPHDLGSWPSWISNAALADLPRVYHGPESRLLRHLEWVWGANLAGRKSSFETLGGFDESIGPRGDERGTFEDVELQDRVRAAHGHVWYCPDAVVYHRVPAHAAMPRSLVRVAFNRGANDYGRARRGSYVERVERVPATQARAAIALPWFLGRWVCWGGAFRLTRRNSVFELGRRSAWGAGWCMAAATKGQGSRWARALQRFALLVRAVALRLTPGTGKIP